MNNLIREISVFNKKTELLVEEYVLPPEISLEQLQQLFLIDDSDDYDLVWCYQIKMKHTDLFKKYMNIEFDFEKFDYFLECSDPDFYQR